MAAVNTRVESKTEYSPTIELSASRTAQGLHNISGARPLAVDGLRLTRLRRRIRKQGLRPVATARRPTVQRSSNLQNLERNSTVKDPQPSAPLARTARRGSGARRHGHL